MFFLLLLLLAAVGSQQKVRRDTDDSGIVSDCGFCMLYGRSIPCVSWVRDMDQCGGGVNGEIQCTAWESSSCRYSARAACRDAWDASLAYFVHFDFNWTTEYL